MIEKLDFGQAKRIWDEVESHNLSLAPFSSYEWHRVWRETLGANATPLPLLWNQKLIFPLASLDDKVFFSGGEETSDYMDLIGDATNFNDVRLAWNEVLVFLRQQGFQKLILRNIPEGLTVNYFSDLRGLVEKEDTTPLLQLPKTWEEYLANLPRKWRKELKRKMRNFENDNEGVYLEEVGSIDCLINLMKKSEVKREFFDRPGMEDYFRKLFEALPTRAKVRCLSVRGELAASIYYFETADSFLLYNSGFDKEKYDSAGLYIKALNIRQAIEAGKKTYNFLQGNERYKYEFGAKDSWVYKIEMEI